jgi:hypothetical protein
MNGPTQEPGIPRPWHLWLIGVLSLAWNGIGAFDYVMTQTRNASYMSTFTPEQLAYFYSFPMWAVAAWALSVWCGVLGSVLLLLRTRWAVAAFAVSLATMLVAFFHNYVLTSGFAIMGGLGALAFSGTIMLVGVALLVYARRLGRGGVLR